MYFEKGTKIFCTPWVFLFTSPSPLLLRSDALQLVLEEMRKKKSTESPPRRTDPDGAAGSSPEDTTSSLQERPQRKDGSQHGGLPHSPLRSH